MFLCNLIVTLLLWLLFCFDLLISVLMLLRCLGCVLLLFTGYVVLG